MGAKQKRPGATPDQATTSTAAGPSEAASSNALQQDLMRGALAGTIAPEDRAVRPIDVMDVATALQIDGSREGPYGRPAASGLIGFAAQLNTVAMALTTSEAAWDAGDHEGSMASYKQALMELQVVMAQVMAEGAQGPALVMVLDLQVVVADEAVAVAEAEQASLLDQG